MPWKWLRRLCVCAVGAGCLLALLSFFRAPILTGLARAWVINDPVAKADAIVVLGGGVDTRPFAAAKLYRLGLAPKILYMNVKLGPAALIVPDALTERELTRRILLSNNVPENALEAIGRSVANTHDESLAVRAWVEKTGAKSLIIATDIFHTRRAHWVFQRELHDQKVKIQMDPVPMLDCDVTNWWQHEDGLIAFETEVIKDAYYRMKY